MMMIHSDDCTLDEETEQPAIWVLNWAISSSRYSLMFHSPIFPAPSSSQILLGSCSAPSNAFQRGLKFRFKHDLISTELWAPHQQTNAVAVRSSIDLASLLHTYVYLRQQQQRYASRPRRRRWKPVFIFAAPLQYAPAYLLALWSFLRFFLYPIFLLRSFFSLQSCILCRDV